MVLSRLKCLDILAALTVLMSTVTWYWTGGQTVLLVVVPTSLVIIKYWRSIFAESLLFSVVLAVLLIRGYIYGESPNFKSILGLLLLVLFIKTKSNKIIENKLVVWILALTFALYSLNGLASLFGYGKELNPTNDEYLVRFTGFLGGSNVTANFMGILAILLINKIKNIYNALLIVLISLSAAISSLSRGIYFLVFGGLFARINKVFLLSVLVIVLNLLNHIDIVEISSLIDRFSRGSERSEKLYLYFHLVNESWIHWFFGIPSSMEGLGVGLSDNSLILIASHYGLIVALYIIVFALIDLKEFTLQKLVLYIMILLNNTILWILPMMVLVFFKKDIVYDKMCTDR